MKASQQLQLQLQLQLQRQHLALLLLLLLSTWCASQSQSFSVVSGRQSSTRTNPTKLYTPQNPSIIMDRLHRLTSKNNDTTKIPTIPVEPYNHDTNNNTTKNGTLAPTPSPTFANGSTAPPVPVIPIPTPPPHAKNATQTPTTAPHTSPPTPTPAPTKPYHPPNNQPTHPPTLAPAPGPGPAPSPHHTSAGISFLRMIGKMIAWCIIMGLAVLLYGFCINHRYQIAYYARHCGHSLRACYRWLCLKLRRRNGAADSALYSPLYPEDAQSMQTLIFDPPMGGLFGDSSQQQPQQQSQQQSPDYSADGFVMGQHSNFQFQAMNNMNQNNGGT